MPLYGEVKVNGSFSNQNETLHSILKKFNAEINECIAIGDDKTLIPSFEKEGLAIAFNSRSKNAERHANIEVKSNDLHEILPHVLNKQHLGLKLIS